jgi:putative peptide zinc metalloprotease protein
MDLLSEQDPAAPLDRATGLQGLPAGDRADLAEALEREPYRAGDVVVREGEVGDRFFFIVEGEAEVWTDGPQGAVSLATLGPGDVFGELAIFAPGGRRSASVSMLTPGVIASVPADRLRAVLARNPPVEAAFARHAEHRALVRFVDQVGPLAVLDEAQRRALVDGMQPLEVARGAEIVRQGDAGDTCYLLREGRVEILRDGEQVDVLGPGGLFGESALLAQAPRSATVRALEPCRALLLRRDDALAAMESDERVADRLVDLLRLRERPTRVDCVLTERRTTADGEPMAILKDPRRGAYFRLSAPGLFVWERLDGTCNVRELTLEYMREHGAFAPHALADVVAGLADAEFITASRVGREESRDAPSRGLTARARQLVDWRLNLSGVDGPLGRIYARFLQPVFTVPAQVGLAVLALAGLAAFVAGAGEAGSTLGDSAAPLAAVLPAVLVGTVVHEAGHAFTTKAFGREVPRVGIGWYWFGPVAFVDTTDMWLGTRRERILVSLAGPYAEALLAGLLAIAGLLVPGGFASACLWSAALALYAPVLINFCPLLEFDGYYILIDLLDRPNLRPRALDWIGRELPKAVRDHTRLRGHGIDLFYGLASLAFVLVMGLLTLLVYRLTLRDTLSDLVGEAFGTALGWAFAVAVVTSTLAASVGELRARPPPRSRVRGETRG